MAALKAKDRVEHKNDTSLGVGVVQFVDQIADVLKAHVRWGGATGLEGWYTEAQLCVVQDLAGQLASAGPAPRYRSSCGFWAAGSRHATNRPARSRTSRLTCCLTKSLSPTA